MLFMLQNGYILTSLKYVEAKLFRRLKQIAIFILISLFNEDNKVQQYTIH